MPNGFLLCNGALVSRTEYADLFAAIGTTCGAGDGSTTFGLPDYRDRVPQGAGTSNSPGVEVSEGLPEITGSFSARGIGADGVALLVMSGNLLSRSIYDGEMYGLADIGSLASEAHTYTMSANRMNSIYGGSSSVQQAAFTSRFLIKT